MKKNIYKSLMMGVLMAGGLVSCQKDLNRTPNNSATADQVFSTPTGYKQALAKVYGAFALTGSNGSGTSDLGGIDAGSSDFVRLWWNAQELPTEEAVCIWNDPGIPDFHNMNWSSSNVVLTGLYNRAIYQITVVNSFLRESTDDKLSAHGITGTDADNIRRYRAEARFLRAFQYWVLMDEFGNPPFVDENFPIGKTFPPQISRAKLFDYVESELKAIDPLLAAPRANEYGRVDQAADWALLARLYLNAGVYQGTSSNAHLNDAVNYSSKVIASGYTLNSSYKKLFMGDNNVNNPETILSINYDGVNTQNYGGTTYIINASISGSMNPASFGVPSGGWGGNRATKNLPLLFSDYSGNTDKRAMFAGSKLEMDDENTFTDGLAVVKYSNLTSTGATPANVGGVYASTDFPLFRLAEMYLVYAEATLRGGNGNANTALQYFNALRTRAYGNTSGNVTGITTEDILKERGRELYWEGFRRTDLIRYGEFYGDNNLWPWKGGVKNGRAVEPYRVLYPLPATDVTANQNLRQNSGY